MSGNRGVGIRVVSDESNGGVEVGAIPEAPAAVAETIYVGRASFHMEVDHASGKTAAAVVVVPDVAPEVDSGAWFRETPAPAPEHERTAMRLPPARGLFSRKVMSLPCRCDWLMPRAILSPPLTWHG